MTIKKARLGKRWKRNRQKTTWALSIQPKISGNFGWYIKWKGPFRFGLTELFGTSFEGGPLWPVGRWYWNVPFLTKLSSPVPLFCILLTRTITKRAVAFSAIMVITKDLKKIRITLVNAPFLFFYLQESHESQRRACLRCCISLSYHWSANSDLILWLWDYFHKRMVGIFSCSSKYSLRRFWFTTMKWKPLLTHFLTPVSAPLYPSTLFSLQSLALIDRAHTLELGSVSKDGFERRTSTGSVACVAGAWK